MDRITVIAIGGSAEQKKTEQAVKREVQHRLYGIAAPADIITEQPTPGLIAERAWEPTYSQANGGWYVGNVRYPSGAVGHVAKGAGGGWAIVCQPDAGEFDTRDDAARAERRIVKRMKATR